MDTGLVQDLPHGGGGDAVAEADQFALHAQVSPAWVLGGQTDDELLDCRCSRGTSAPAACGVVPLPGDQPAMPGQDRGRRDRKDLGPARTRQQPGQGRQPHPIGRCVADPDNLRRSTAFSWRNTSSSASLLRSFRTNTAIRPSSQRTSWYKIDNSGIRRSSTTDRQTRSSGQDAESGIRAPHDQSEPRSARRYAGVSTGQAWHRRKRSADLARRARGCDRRTPCRFPQSQLRIIRQTAIDITFMCNDVYSLEKEETRGDMDNLILVIDTSRICPARKRLHKHSVRSPNVVAASSGSAISSRTCVPS